MNVRYRIRIISAILCMSIVAYTFIVRDDKPSNKVADVTKAAKIEESDPVKQNIELRRRRIREYCDGDEEESERTYGVVRRLIVDADNEITWCPICKAGSTIWMTIFATLGKELDTSVDLPNLGVQISKLARIAYPFMGTQKVNKILNKTTKFLIVRHPFERLLSAYRDKLEDPTKKYYHNKFGRYIVEWYRRSKDNDTVPTFEEFLRYIVTEKSFDEHWNPYHRECAPCHVDYDFILKTESLADELRYFIDYLGIDAIKSIYKFNKWDNTNPLGRTDEDYKKFYFSKIPLQLLKNLYEIYQKDFVMFDYSPDEYYNCINSDQ